MKLTEWMYMILFMNGLKIEYSLDFENVFVIV